MVAAHGHPVVDVGAEAQESATQLCPNASRLDRKLDREEGRLVDRDAALFHRRYKKITVALALEHGGEQLDQGGPADRSLLVEPGTIGRKAHVDRASLGRIPQVYRGWPL